jgi:hypothetical protein
MKKLATLLAGAALCTASYAQLAPGSTAPNWTFSDLNGNSWDLYTLLNQGKTVFIDVSATWCGPCWNYHNSHALADLYNSHGPSGTVDQMAMVFFIEGDGSTTIADLNGTGGNTQGNWVTGTPYPIIDPGSSSNSFNNDYAIAYFPTIYMVCPSDKKVYEVGQLSEAQLVAAMNTCAYNNDVLPTGAPSIGCATQFAPTFTLKNNSFTTTLTATDVAFSIDGGSPQNYSWTGSLAAGQSTTVTLPVQTLTVGSHTLAVTASNPNGGVDANNNNNSGTYTFNISTANGTASPMTNNFSTSGFPYTNWILNNPDGGLTWNRTAAINGGSIKLDCFTYSAAGAIDEVMIEPVDLSSTTTPSLMFNVAHARYSSAYNDELQVYASGDCGVTWTQLWSKSGATGLATVPNQTTSFAPSNAGQWRSECLNLAPYNGNSKVFLMFRSINGYGNNIYIDDINVSNTACPTGIQNVTLENGMSVYPNPMNDNATVSFNLAQASNVTMSVYNMVGELVYSNGFGTMPAGNQLVRLNAADLSNGMYFVEINSGGVRSVQKVSVSK